MELELEKELNYRDCLQVSEYLEEFPIIDYKITYSTFFERFIMKNQACLIKNVSKRWISSQLWVTDDGNPNFAYLRKYEACSINVIDCNRINDQCKNWKFKDYIDYWEKPSNNGDLYYLKDWHLKNELPDDYFYEVPIYFASDWINEYLIDKQLDDYRFVYMGIRGTWTPFHVDVMNSYSWSTNVCGQKRWLLFPPGSEHVFKDTFGNLPCDISDVYKSTPHFEIIQNPGDAMFVPSNWYHQVWNCKDTISINHNWINGCNILNIWLAMAEELAKVKNEIQDCECMEDFLTHCQLMLKASFAMNFQQFYDFIACIACKRIDLIKNQISLSLPENRMLGRKHAEFDLWAIQNTLELFIQHEDIEKLTYFKDVKLCPSSLLHDIKKTLVECDR